MIGVMAAGVLIALICIGLVITREWQAQSSDYPAEISEDEYR